MAEDLKFKVAADVSDVLAKMAQAKKSVSDLEDELKALKTQAVKTYDPQEVIKYNAQISALEANIKKIKSASDASMGAVVKGGNQGQQVLTDLGRIASDVPFGFVSIQNNITPLFESFGRLKAGGNVFKELTASLMGPAGFGLAISLVSAAITLATTGFGAWTRAFGSAKTATDEATKELQKFKKEMGEQVAQADAVGIKLKSYLDIAKDVTNTDKQRKAAISEANKIMGQYGETITLANVATQKITQQTDLFVESLKKQAAAQVFSSKIAKEFTDQEEAFQKVNAAQREYNRIYEARVKFVRENQKLNQGQQETILARQGLGLGEEARSTIALTAAKAEYATQTQQLTDVENRYKKVLSEQLEIQTNLGVKEKERKEKGSETEADIIKKLNTELLITATLFNKGIIKGEVFDKRNVEDYTKALEALIKINPNSANVGNFTEQIKAFSDNLGRKKVDTSIELPTNVLPKYKISEPDYFQNLEKFLKSSEYKKVIEEGKKYGVSTEGLIGTNGMDVNFDPQKLAEYNAQITAVKENLATIGSVVQTVGQPFQELFTNLINGSQNAFQAFGNAIKQILVRMAAAAITAAILSAIIGPMFGGGNAGSAMQAATSFKGIFGSLTGMKLANGGYVSGAGTSRSDSIPAMLSNGEFVMNAAAVNRIGLRNLETMNNGQSIGGGLNANIEISGQPMLRGSDIYFSLKQTEKTIGRNG